jgi:hypothetical protein
MNPGKMSILPLLLVNALDTCPFGPEILGFGLINLPNPENNLFLHRLQVGTLVKNNATKRSKKKNLWSRSAFDMDLSDKTGR